METYEKPRSLDQGAGRGGRSVRQPRSTECGGRFYAGTPVPTGTLGTVV